MAKLKLEKAPPSAALIEYKAKLTELARRINGLPQELIDAITRQYLRSFESRRIEFWSDRRIKVTFNGRFFRLRDNEKPFESVVVGLLQKILDAAGEDSKDLRMALKGKIMEKAVECIVRNSVLKIEYRAFPGYLTPQPLVRPSAVLTPVSPSSSRIQLLETNIKHIDLTLFIPAQPMRPRYLDAIPSFLSMEDDLPNIKNQSLHVTVVEVLFARTWKRTYSAILGNIAPSQGRSVLEDTMEKVVKSLVQLDGPRDKRFTFRHKYLGFRDDDPIPSWAPKVYGGIKDMRGRDAVEIVGRAVSQHGISFVV